MEGMMSKTLYQVNEISTDEPDDIKVIRLTPNNYLNFNGTLLFSDRKKAFAYLRKHKELHEKFLASKLRKMR
jgi:hypothetical protein